MYLKKVEIHGFKSFAERTEIEFESGVTGIVGPNGSGKSNISDAVRWVLGEQSAKTLRGSKMEDIIFAGTASRKPVGMAEVSLTLDNTSNRLPIDFSEVTVTRRVYRSGESEYYINKSLCRLKDIKEIFMDTGVGVDGYSIIGQGRIDEILSNKSEDRRLIFEEAAGIVKYKTRKEEAEKKLDNTQQHLIRVNDIIQELEARIEPLKAQSEKAKTFLELQKELKDSDINLIVHELEDIKGNIETLKEQKNIIANQTQDYSRDKEEIEQKHRQLKKKIFELDQSISQLQNNIFETIHLVDKKQGDLELCSEKINNTQENVGRLKNEIHEADETISTLNAQSFEMEKNLLEVENVLIERKTLLNTQFNELEKMLSGLEKQEEDIERAKGNIIEILNSVAGKKSEIHSLNTLQTNLVKRQAQIEAEKLELEKNKNLLLISQNNVEEELGQSEQVFFNLINRKNTLQKQIQDLEDFVNNIRIEIDKSKQKIHEQQTKKSLLEEMEKDYEGFNKSVKNTLIHAKKDFNLGKGIIGVVAELVDVPKGLEIAIEVSLGSTMQNIVCDAAEDAKRVINYLKKYNMGRVTFLPLDGVKANASNLLKAKEFADEKGFIGIAIDSVSFNIEYKNIFQYLLGRVILVDKIENAISLSKKTGHKYKIVSLEGDIINPGGSITGGSYSSRTLNILSRKREIEDLSQEILINNRDFEEKTKLFISNKKNLEELLAEGRQLENLLKEQEINLVNVKNTRKDLSKEIQNHQQNIARIEKEIYQLDTERVEILSSLEIKKKEIEQLEWEQESIQQKVSNSKNLYDDERVMKEKLNGEITNFKIEIASLEQKKQHIEQNTEHIKGQIGELNSIKLSKEQEVSELLQNIEMLTQRLNQIKIDINDGDILKKQYEFNLQQLKDQKLEVDQSYEQIEIQLKKVNEVINELQDSGHKIEVRLARLEIQQESYFNKLWEEYEITYMEALEYKKSDINISETSRLIKNLKSSIKEMGSVNISAIQEYKTVTERYEFLSVQKEDLINAKNSLNQVIKEMESIMRSKFVDSFEKIKGNFNEIFKKLFGGGRADLKFENEEDVLTTGIEIVAQPPGKKLQNLSLLSGGERALTAISLLFAILKVKPTPFCILDEIEAALDDANVYRYADFLKEFSKETQFIVVTHRKGTMEAMDALYGVTMQEEGISKLVSVKLTEKAS